MPLENGVDSFIGFNSYISATSEELIAFFDAKSSILAAFQANPELILNPYEFSHNLGDHAVNIPSDPPLSNPIYLAIVASDLLQFGRRLVDETDWMTFAKAANSLDHCSRYLYADGYALIDMACYLVHLLNIYNPNRTLINNLISTNSKIDVFDRDHNAAAEKAVEKLIKRTLAEDSLLSLTTKSQHIIIIAKHEAHQLK